MLGPLPPAPSAAPIVVVEKISRDGLTTAGEGDGKGAGAADQVGYTTYSVPAKAFDPNGQVPKRGKTWYAWFEELYRTNGHIKTRVDVIVELLMAMDWKIPTASKAPSTEDGTADEGAGDQVDDPAAADGAAPPKPKGLQAAAPPFGRGAQDEGDDSAAPPPRAPGKPKPGALEDPAAIDANDAAAEQWESAKDATDFQTWMRQMLTDMLVRGLGIGVVTDAAELGIQGTALAVQVLNPPNVRPLWDRKLVIRGYHHSARSPGTFGDWAPPLKDSQLPLQSGPIGATRDGPPVAEIYAVEDLIVLMGNRMGHDVHGMPLIMPAALAADETQTLHRLRAQMARKETHSILHAKINAKGLSDKPGPNGERSQCLQRVDEVLDLISDEEVVDQYSQDVGLRTRIATWYHEELLDERSTVTTRKGEVDLVPIASSSNMPAMNEAIRESERILTTYLRVPEVFLPASGGGSNRATSDNELVLFAFTLKSWWMQAARELKHKWMARVLGSTNYDLTHNKIARPSQGPIAASLIDKMTSLHPDERRGWIADVGEVDLDPARAPPAPPPPPPSPFGMPPGIPPGKAPPTPPGRDPGAQRQQVDQGVEAQAYPVEVATRRGPKVPDGPVVRRRRRQMQPKTAKYELDAKALLRAALRKTAEKYAKEARKAFVKAGLPAGVEAAGPDEPPKVDRAAGIKAIRGIEPDPDPLQRALDDYLRQVYDQERGAIVGLSELPETANVKDTSGLDALLAVNENEAAKVITPLGDEARKAYIAAIEAGDDPADAEQALYEAYDGYDVDRLIRTETVRAATTARFDAFRDAGVEKVVWVTADDDLVDADCRELEAAGPMTLADAKATGGPPAHPNCRCYLATADDYRYITGEVDA